METTYQIDYYKGSGRYQGIISNFTYLRYTRVANNIGSLTLEFISEPRSIEYNDYFIVNRNGINDSRTIWLVNSTTYDVVNKKYTINCVDANYLLSTRIVAYPAGSYQSSKSDHADNMIYQIIGENFIYPTDSNRNLTISTGTVNSLGSTFDKAFARQNVLSVIQGICQEYQQSEGKKLYFDLYYTNRFTFRVFENSIGRDISITFGVEYGNVEELNIQNDYTNLATTVYAGGRDTGVNRVIVEESRPIRVSSPYNRVENFINALRYETVDGLQTEANSTLDEMRAKTIITARIKDTSAARYGRDWSFGDRITVDALGVNYSANIDAVRVHVTRNTEDINAYFSVVT